MSAIVIALAALAVWVGVLSIQVSALRRETVRLSEAAARLGWSTAKAFNAQADLNKELRDWARLIFRRPE